ncbi:MAG: response regulator, partial [Ignavibacteriaceae bacterium]
NITVRSQVSKGSIFTVVLPVEVVHLIQNKKLEVNIVKTFDDAEHSPVLIIEHQQNIRQMIANYVNSKGYDAIFAESPDQCLPLAQRTLPFALLFDTSFPALNFWKIIYALQTDVVTKNIPVIFYSTNEEKKTGFALSPNEILVKPLTQAAIAKTLKHASGLVHKDELTFALLDDETGENLFSSFPESFREKIRRYDQLEKFSFEEDALFVNPFYQEGNALKKCSEMFHSSEGFQKLLFLLLPENISEEEIKSGQKTLAWLAGTSKGNAYEVLKIIRNAFYFLERGKQKSIPPFEEETFESREIAQLKKERMYGENYAGEVLIVDDDPDSLFTINEIVQKCNCTTILAKNGKECLEILEKQKPDVILLDIMMPVMDGFQTLKAIREKSALKDIPVIAVTAKAMIEDREIILKQGFDSYITKPINSGVLAFRLTKALTEKKAAEHEKDLSNR